MAITNIRAVILDMDGVIYRGDKLVPGVKDAIAWLDRKGMRVFYLTNAGTKSRKKRAEKLCEFGIPAREDQVYTASYAAAKYIKEKFGTEKKVFYIGEEGMGEELANFGIPIVYDNRADIVLVGLDRRVTYEKFDVAFKAIINGAEFIATNKDATFPIENDRLMPGAGALVNFLEYSTRKKSLVVGKPNRYMFDMIVSDSGLMRSDFLIVGDRLESDIVGGKKAKMKTLLVFTGVTKKEELKNKKLRKNERPDCTLDSLANISSLLGP